MQDGEFNVKIHECQQQRQAGASLDEMKQKGALDGFEDFNFDWALSLSACIEAVYREQTG